MMDPRLKPYFDHVLVLFWPVLIWNLMRIARWRAHTGQDGLWAVNCFGGVRLVRASDTPRPSPFAFPENAARLSATMILTDLPDGLRTQPLRAVREGMGLACAGVPLYALPLPLPLPDT